MLGDYAHARAFLDESLRLFEFAGHGNKIAWGLRKLSYVALREDKPALAYQLVMQSVQANIQLNSRAGLVNCLAALAGILVDREMFTTAAKLCGAVSAQLDSLHTYLYFLERFEYQKTTDLLRRRLDATALDEAWAEGRTLTLEQAVALALEIGETVN
jgi:hypothetical protein